MEHAYAAAALMVLAAAFASAVALHAYEEAQRAGAGVGAVGSGLHAGGGAARAAAHLVDTGVRIDGIGPAIATLTVSNAGHARIVSANATACGASGLLGAAAGDGNWSLGGGSAASVAWAAPCDAGPVLVRVEYELADGASGVRLHRECAGRAWQCAGGEGGGGAARAGGPPGDGPRRPAPDADAPAPQKRQEEEQSLPPPPPAPAFASCTVDGMSTTVCINGSGVPSTVESYEIYRRIAPGPAAYSAVSSMAPAGGGEGRPACHRDAAPHGSASAAYTAAASGPGGKSAQSRAARAEIAEQACYIDTPGGERVGSPSGPPAPQPASPSDYRIAMYDGIASTPRTVQAYFGPDRYVVERQSDGSWSRLGFAPPHPQDSLTEYLAASMVARDAAGEADVRYVRADLILSLEEFWGARR